MALFGSPEWVAELERQVNSSRELSKAGRGFNAAIQFLVEEDPSRGGYGFWARVKDGRIAECGTGERADCQYQLKGDLETWKSVIEGNEDAIQAIMAKRLVFEGNLQAVMKYLKPLDIIMGCLKKVPTEF